MLLYSSTIQENANTDIIDMYVCMVITYSRVWINRVRLPIELVVSCPRSTCLHICGVRDTIITAPGPHLRIRFFLYSTQVLYQPTAAPRKACQRCCKQSLIITTLHGGLFHGKAAFATVGAAVARYC